jgi:DNA segregation ATPase FtsK/SpoIIIE, S-DNA-T family
VNSQPGVKEMLALLEALKNTVRVFVAREEKLNSEFHLQAGLAQNELTARGEQQELAAARHLMDAENALQEERNRHEALFQKRRDRITRAHASLSERGLNEIGTHDRKWSERTQQMVVEMEQQREKDLAQAAADQEDFGQKLAAVEVQLEETKVAARGAFRGYGRFRRLLAPGRPWPEPELSANHRLLYDELQGLQRKIKEDLARFKTFPFPLIFKFIPAWLLELLLLGVAVANPVLAHFGRHDVSGVEAGVAAGLLALLVVIHWVGGRGATPVAVTIAGNFAKAGRLIVAAREKFETHYVQEQERIKAEFEGKKHAANQQWRQAVRDINYQRETWPVTIAEKAAKLERRLEEWDRREQERIQQHQAATLADLKRTDLGHVRRLTETHEARLAELQEKNDADWQQLVADWNREIQSLCDRLAAARVAAENLFPAWEAAGWERWTPPADFQNTVKFGNLEVAVAEFVEAMPKDKRLAWPGPATLSVPLSLVCPLEGSILFESGKTSGGEAFGVINNIIFRLLSVAPPGRLNFTIFDPVGLGQNFATLMHLADYEEGCINSRIWTQTAQFEEKLAELNEHMEKIIQMYLRNEYATIADYNAEAGSVAEKYHYLVIASFPVNFNENAARRLRNIAASGARCGVHLLVHWDQRNAAPSDFVPDELRQNSVCLTHTGRGLELSGWRASGTRLLLDPPPAAEFATGFLQRIGEGSKNANRVEVPFQQIAPPETEMWKEQTAELLRVPIGRSGATKLQYLEIGTGTRQHALIAGKTGSGKSTLFHVMITNLALRCSPEQVEFYLVDFKKGVEFKCYASRHLPHARVVAIESDRGFGLSVLQRVDDELRRRGDLFRKLGAQDLAGYQRAGGGPVPRTLLMIDEFQEFFTEEDHVSQGAAVLLDRIVRQGRAFGIHVLLGSQTLGGAYTLARATIGQMVIRIALQCNEADALLIMDQDNPAPRLLSRPGEGIYNDAAGAIEGNSPFQAVWLSDRERDGYLAKIRERADGVADHRYPGPIVFEGNAPADPAENFALQAALRETRVSQPEQAGVWLGAPNSIKGPTEAVFHRQSGSNLLVVAQSDERPLTILSLALISLAARYPKKGARFVVLDNTAAAAPQREFLQRVIRAVPQETALAGNTNLAEVMEALGEELRRRTEDESTGAEIFLLVHSLQNFKKLRQEDEFSFSSSDAGGTRPAAVLLKLITEGPARGIHVIVTCDTYNNVNRFLGRKMLTEFEMRVVFQMSAADSASLIDAPDASTLGLHRALYYNDREGQLETFRPYAPPEGPWLEAAGADLKGRQ